eukprot:gnl/MRDRNA2_/MRDRNA2_72337_c0_seq3.p2 gnl/MRDRNA2_/MRDRNA2_72337_c0~~gnl/MRDRNA2_/MRDRNA2_72337_c0_seq3.p2  ORF type:complete len:105 (+),score=15.35 gnl/MRDRNA2_/MRDRNA2_72337_c0_seq3:2-316(+)
MEHVQCKCNGPPLHSVTTSLWHLRKWGRTVPSTAKSVVGILVNYSLYNTIGWTKSGRQLLVRLLASTVLWKLASKGFANEEQSCAKAQQRHPFVDASDNQRNIK